MPVLSEIASVGPCVVGCRCPNSVLGKKDFGSRDILVVSAAPAAVVGRDRDRGRGKATDTGSWDSNTDQNMASHTGCKILDDRMRIGFLGDQLCSAD